MKSLMTITKPCVVALTWTLKDSLGQELDVLDEPIEFLVGGHDLLAKIEEALQGYGAGDAVDLYLEPPDAFGNYDDQLLFLEPRHLFPAELQDGMVFEGLPPGCSGSAPANRLYFVSGLYPEHVVLDGNHPLAGISLRISIKVHAVRQAQKAELAAGSIGHGFFTVRSNIDPTALQTPDLPNTLH